MTTTWTKLKYDIYKYEYKYIFYIGRLEILIIDYVAILFLITT